MQIAAFKAFCPFEIGDAVYVVGKRMCLSRGRTEGELFKTITDIALTHFLKSGDVEFSYEFDGSGAYHMGLTVPTDERIKEIREEMRKEAGQA